MTNQLLEEEPMTAGTVCVADPGFVVTMRLQECIDLVQALHQRVYTLEQLKLLHQQYDLNEP